MSDAVTLHSRFNRLAAVFCWAGSALFATIALLDPGWPTAWLIPGAALLAFWAWAALWQTHVSVTDDGVHIENVTHTVDVPWAALVHVETRYALTLITPRARFAAWAAPAPGALRAAAAGRRADNRELRVTGGPARPGDLLGTESGDAAMLVREKWQKLLDGGAIAVGVADDIVVGRRPRTGVIAALALGAALTIIAFTLH
jgi:hypothetical protein